jgi:hypothetical protein
MKHRGSIHSSDRDDARENFAKGVEAAAELLERAAEKRAAQILRDAKIINDIGLEAIKKEERE